MIYPLILVLSVMAGVILFADAASKNKAHGHQGALEHYDGKPIPLKPTDEQLNKLTKGESVTFNERIGKLGRGVVIQDINASVPVCMDKIRDLPNYPKMVPHCKKVEVYTTNKFANGTSKTGAEFSVGVLGMRFGYYLLLTHEPKFNTLTWTLDYKYNSDFDDNVGHWQVMTHPTKAGWSRVLYSTKVKLFPWIPEFVVNFLTSKALVESTTWLKREAEAEAVRRAALNPTASPLNVYLPKWFSNGGSTLKAKFEQAKATADAEFEIYRKQVWSSLPPKFRSFKLGF